jgi:hypothetical protein
LRWYANTFGGGYIPEEEMSWLKKWKILRNNPVQQEASLRR